MAKSAATHRLRVKGYETTEPVFTCEIINRESDETVGTRDYDVTKLPDENKIKVMKYGLGKLVQDRTSDVKAHENKLEAMDEVFELLCSGGWEKERTRGAPTVSPEIEAVARLMNSDVPTVQLNLKKKDAGYKERLFASEKVQELADQIRKERENATELDFDAAFGITDEAAEA